MRIYPLLFMATILVAFSNCTPEDDRVSYSDGTSKIYLSVKNQQQVQVKGADDPQSEISDAHFLFFDGYTCVKHVYVDTGNSTQVEIPNGTYTCYAVTNTGQSGLFSESTTLADLEEDFSYALPKKNYWETGNPLPAFIMGGKKDFYIHSSGGRYEVPVYRIVAKIDVVITANIQDPDLGKYHFTFEEITLEGFPLKSTYCPNNNLYPSSDDISFREMAFTAEDGVVNLSFYMLENLAGGRISEDNVPLAMKEKYPDIYGENDQKGKRKYAPDNAPFLQITGKAVNTYGDQINTVHYIYLGHNPANDYSVARNENHTYTININGVKDLDVDTRVEIAVEQPEFSDLDPANNYMVHNSGNYYIPATFMGNRKDKPLSEIMGNIDVETLTAEFLWTDNKESIWLETIEYADDPKDPTQKIIKFRVRGNPEMNINDRGNTIIALYGYDKADTNHENPIILWTWHIWLTDKPKEVVVGGKAKATTQDGILYPATTQTLIVMDRNLGATSANPHEGGVWNTYGCHYQMGRKDPFPNAKKDGVWFLYADSTAYDIKGFGYSEVITHLKFSEPEPFEDFNNDTRCAFNEKLAPDKVNGFKYLQEGISGLYATRNPMVFATKFQTEDTRWTDKDINDLENDPLYDVTGNREDYWNRQKTVHDPCPSGWTVLGDQGSFWNQSPQLDVFTYGGFKDSNGKYIGGIYSQLDGYAKVWWPADGVRTIYGKLANLGQTSVFHMFDHIDSHHGAHAARFLLNTEINATQVNTPFTIQGKDAENTGTFNGLFSQINVNGNNIGTNQAATVRCVKVDQNLGNLNSRTVTQSEAIRIN